MSNTSYGREFVQQMTHYLRKRITYLDAGTTVDVGLLPPGSVVVRAGVIVITAFDGNSSNVLDIGTEDDTDDFATDISLATAGMIIGDELATANNLYNSTGKKAQAVVVATASPSAGEGIVFVEYFVNNDQ